MMVAPTILKAKRKELAKNVKILDHPQNAGKCKAMLTGVKSAKFDLICVIDGDGQNPPYEIKKNAYWNGRYSKKIGKDFYYMWKQKKTTRIQS